MNMERNIRNRIPYANHEGKGGRHAPKIMEVVAVALVFALLAFALGYLGVMLAGEPAANQTGKPAAALESAHLQNVSPSTAPVAAQELASMRSLLPSPLPAATPSPEYLYQLRQHAVVVNTEKEFFDALNTANAIVLGKDITLSGEYISLNRISALVIDKGVTLTVTCWNFHADCSIVNLGEIIVDGSGRMIFFSEPDYSCIGKISIKGSDAEICFNSGKIGADEIAYFLCEGSLYSSLNIVANTSDGKLVEILIDHDITIPAGKTLWMNCDSVLHVPKGVSLTNNGQIRYYNEPIIEGEIKGTGRVLNDS